MYSLPAEWDGHSANSDKDLAFQSLNQTSMESVFKAACSLYGQASMAGKTPRRNPPDLRRSKTQEKLEGLLAGFKALVANKSYNVP